MDSFLAMDSFFVHGFIFVYGFITCLWIHYLFMDSLFGNGFNLCL